MIQNEKILRRMSEGLVCNTRKNLEELPKGKDLMQYKRI